MSSLHLGALSAANSSAEDVNVFVVKEVDRVSIQFMRFSLLFSVKCINLLIFIFLLHSYVYEEVTVERR